MIPRLWLANYTLKQQEIEFNPLFTWKVCMLRVSSRRKKISSCPIAFGYKIAQDGLNFLLKHMCKNWINVSIYSDCAPTSPLTQH